MYSPEANRYGYEVNRISFGSPSKTGPEKKKTQVRKENAELFEKDRVAEVRNMKSTLENLVESMKTINDSVINVLERLDVYDKQCSSSSDRSPQNTKRASI
ncbi:hypothetical protein AAVH_19760 [Aphelenchoides avenae]|nr:hypothetical protein AAVH_19760 [Aphelenchus avenae]